MPMYKLKACPFCSGKANIWKCTKKEALERFPAKRESIVNYPDSWWVLGCETEGCILEANREKHFIKIAFRAGSAREAATKWNRRADE